MGFLDGTVVKNMPASERDAGYEGSIPDFGRFPGGGTWQPTPVSLPGESHGQRSLLGCSPLSCKEKDTPEHTHTSCQYSHV